jgi:hypothetical protein
VYPQDWDETGSTLARAIASARLRYQAQGPLVAHAVRLEGIADSLREQATCLHFEVREADLLDAALCRVLGDLWWQHLRSGRSREGGGS